MKTRTAAFAACGILAVATVVSSVVGDPMSHLTGTVPLPRPLKTSIPADLAGWNGVDDPMSDAVVRTVQVDDYVRRHYVHASFGELLLYVAYHGNKERGMQTYYHNPTVCFPSQGWASESEQTSTETLTDAAKEIPVCRYVFSKAGARLSVMTFFKVDDEMLDQSPRNKFFWMLIDRATPQFDDLPGTFVQVQIIAPVGAGGVGQASDAQSRFLQDFGSVILSAVAPGSRD